MTQDEALDILKLGHNVFLTGAAGAGKTWLLNRYISHLGQHGVAVAVTASTGIAATHLGGRTIHSWSGMGVREALTANDLAKIKGDKRLKKSIGKTKVLVIDEISMLHPAQLDMVDQVARALLDPALPFGGLQVILCGDFFQLPPVSKQQASGDQRFAFAAHAWREGELRVCYLHEQHRQRNDPLLAILNDIRAGQAGEHSKVPLRTRYRRDPEGDTKPTVLYSRNVNVDAINQRELAKLPGDERHFAMETRGLRALVDGLKKNCLAPEVLRLKKGAEVMFVKNAAEGTYVNGTRATVIGFDREEGWPRVRTFDGAIFTATPVDWTLEDDGAIRASLTQVPLRLAWAVTIHKSQGMTLDAVEIDLSDAFEPGMGYVGLSRARRLNGLKLLGLNEIALQVNAAVLQQDVQFKRQSADARTYVKALDTSEKHCLQKQILCERFQGKAPGQRIKNKSPKHLDDQTVNAATIKKSKESLSDTLQETLSLVRQQLSLSEMAEQRGLKEDTILNHLEKLKGRNRLPDVSYLSKALNPADLNELIAVFRESDTGYLKQLHEQFAGRFSFLELKLARLLSWE